VAPRYDLVIVGMGSGGIAAAELAATIGIRVAAIERDRVGGDCLWTGCVPSKALLASARVAHRIRTADRYGLPAAAPEIDTGAVWRRIREVQDEIARTDDNPERFEDLGVEVIKGSARLAGPRAVLVEGRRLDTRFVLLATGSRPAVPSIPGLTEAGFLTSETIWGLERAPRSVVIIGGGPMGVELAQALNRLGVRTTLLQRRSQLLPRDEPELVDLLTAVLRDEGVEVALGVGVDHVTTEDGVKVVHGDDGDGARRWNGEEIVVATGRTPNVEALGLGDAGVDLGTRGVRVDSRLRTSVRSIYASGDVAGRFLFTHSAAYEAATAVRNMFFPGWSNVPKLIPWCTFTDPELAHAGLTAAEAKERHGAGRVRLHRSDLSHSDRARADGATHGALVVVIAGARVVGAHALAPAAGELIHELALLVRDRKKLLELSSLVHVYPTIATSVNQLVADDAYALARRYGWLARRGARATTADSL
jgi:pyruvate/2-oxoglutarate dehydrogenase complex dihydrolipoamide dehydrogenase (E3) component